MAASPTTSHLDFILRLIDQVTIPAARIATSLDDVAKRGSEGFKTMGTGVAGLVGSFWTFAESMQPARDQLRALGEVRSLGAAEDALDSLQAKSFEFATAYGESATAFVQSAYGIEGAIKGLTGSQLAMFTNASNVLAKATKSDADTISAYIGTLYGMNKAQADAMGKGEWVEMLAGQSAMAVQLFRTSGQQLNDAFKATGIGASAAGVSLAEQMAVLGTLGSTLEGGEAGGLYKSFFENITNAQTKLGMKFTDSNGKLMPMLDILDKLKGKFGDLDTQADLDAITGAFGGEASRLIVTLMKDTDRLRGGLDKLGQVKGMEQAEAMAKNMVDPFAQFGAMVQNLRIVMGQVLMPVLTPLIQRITAMGTTFQRWLTMFPNVARWLGYVTLAVLGLVAAAGMLTVLGGLVSVISILFSPIALLIAGIALLVVAVGAAIIWWDELKAKFGDTAWFQVLMTIITPVVLVFKVLVAVLQLGWVALQQLWEIGVNVVSWLADLVGATSGANEVWDSLLWAFQNLSPFALMGKALRGLIDLLNKIPGVSIDTSFADLPEVPGAGDAISAADSAAAAQKMQQTINAAIPSLSPTQASSVPPGGLLTRIQNTSNQSKGNHIEKVEIHTGKAITPMELENIMAMAAG